MKVFINTSFKGFYPVGTSAIVIANNSKIAAMLLSEKLSSIGLTQEIKKEDMQEISLKKASVIILQHGDY